MTQLSSKVTPVYPTEPVFPLTVEQYHTMIETGVLTDDDPVELIEGVLVFHMPKNPPHTYVLEAVTETLRPLLPSGWTLRAQEPVTLDDGEPEPDVVIARGNRRRYRQRHPGPADVGIVIEVSDSTLDRDRGTKLRSYARAGIAEYWIVNVAEQVIEVRTEPLSDGTEPSYRHTRFISAPKTMSLILGGETVAEISVRDFFD